jgi:hypothetical protein
MQDDLFDELIAAVSKGDTYRAWAVRMLLQMANKEHDESEFMDGEQLQMHPNVHRDLVEMFGSEYASAELTPSQRDIATFALVPLAASAAHPHLASVIALGETSSLTTAMAYLESAPLLLAAPSGSVERQVGLEQLNYLAKMHDIPELSKPIDQLAASFRSLDDIELNERLDDLLL